MEYVASIIWCHYGALHLVNRCERGDLVVQVRWENEEEKKKRKEKEMFVEIEIDSACISRVADDSVTVCRKKSENRGIV